MLELLTLSKYITLYIITIKLYYNIYFILRHLLTLYNVNCIVVIYNNNISCRLYYNNNCYSMWIMVTKS